MTHRPESVNVMRHMSLLGLLVLAGCATEAVPMGGAPAPSSITLDAMSLLAGDAIAPQVTVTVGGETRAATPAELRITSSNTDVVIIGADNALLAVGDGQSVITVTWAATPTVFATRTVTIVSEKLNGVRLSGPQVMVSGDSVVLDVVGAIPGGHTILRPASVVLTSRNPAIVSILGTAATANAPGASWIVAASTTGIADSVLVSVVAGAPAHVVISPESASVVAGQQLRLAGVTISDLRGNAITNVTPSYVSTVPGVALVQPDGTVVGVAAGNAMIVVTAGSASDTLRLTVAPAPLQQLVLSPDSMLLRPGDTARVAVKALDGQGNQMALPTLTWTSLTSGITVSSSGLVTASNAVSATIANGAVQVASGNVTAQLRVVVFVAPAPALQRLLVSPDSVMLNPGGSAQIQVQAMNNLGGMMAVPPLTWQSLTNGISVSSGGVITASSGIVSSIMNGVVRVSSGGIFTDVRVVVIVIPAPPPPSDGGYVQVRWVGTMPSAPVVAAFEAARVRINSLFKSFGAIPTVAVEVTPGACMTGTPGMNEQVPGIVIFASVTSIDGVGNILGSAGPCYVRTSTWLPLVGAMQFDVADMNSMANNGTLSGVILHEMMHTLGFGVIWGPGPQQQVLSPSSADPRHDGVNARQEYIALGPADGLLGVPVENTGGSGTRGSHWRESVFHSELMTGWADGTLPMSRVTVGALKDFGYDVDLNKADPFTLTGSGVGAGLRASQLIVETTFRPIGMVGPDGKIVPYNGPQ